MERSNRYPTQAEYCSDIEWGAYIARMGRCTMQRSWVRSSNTVVQRDPSRAMHVRPIRRIYICILYSEPFAGTRTGYRRQDQLKAAACGIVIWRVWFMVGRGETKGAEDDEDADTAGRRRRRTRTDGATFALRGHDASTRRAGLHYIRRQSSSKCPLTHSPMNASAYRLRDSPGCCTLS